MVFVHSRCIQDCFPWHCPFFSKMPKYELGSRFCCATAMLEQTFGSMNNAGAHGLKFAELGSLRLCCVSRTALLSDCTISSCYQCHMKVCISPVLTISSVLMGIKINFMYRNCSYLIVRFLWSMSYVLMWNDVDWLFSFVCFLIREFTCCLVCLELSLLWK